jgi:hypoxanthine-DNA glycosylase
MQIEPPPLMMNESTFNDLPVFSFAPIADLRSKILILGTIPGKESLKKQAYYAHPQNAFWKIIFALYDVSFSTDHEVRREVLLQNGIALWDVLQSCHRASSLDNDIKMERPNDLRAFLSHHPNISQIFFNGKGSAVYFKKYFPDITLPARIMPSTSPTHAIKWATKLELWKVIKNYGNK